MPISDTSPPGENGAASRARGYTLLELLVVLTILGLASAIAAPAAVRLVASWRSEAAIRDAGQQMSRLPWQARISASPIVIRRIEDWPTVLGPLPEGIRIIRPVTVSASGFCGGGRIRLELEGVTSDALVTAPFCELDRVESAP